MKNVVLIGMPGAGKSTIGVLLAKSLLMDFVDTDLIIQKECGAALCDIIEKVGVESFIEKENEIICASEFENSVVATGGSVIYGKEAMKKLKENSVVVYLSLPTEELEKRIFNIKTRGIAMKKGTTLSELFRERKELYEKYADIELSCFGLTAEECVSEIIKKLK
ncbi:MAG: shikimate kinase [Clostridia bacterium]|nr:shikimate kinase [Clostridia bacterium]